MGKAKRAEKRALREAKGADKEEQVREMEERQSRTQRMRRILLIGIPVVTLGAAAALGWGFGDARLAGVVLLLGAIAFFLYALSTLGKSVQPRDRKGAGSINFGKRG